MTKKILLQYLQRGRDSLLWKLEGLGEYDIRRPMVPTGTNLLGLVKHVASIEAGYFGATFGRPFPEPLPLPLPPPLPPPEPPAPALGPGLPAVAAVGAATATGSAVACGVGSADGVGVGDSSTTTSCGSETVLPRDCTRIRSRCGSAARAGVPPPGGSAAPPKTNSAMRTSSALAATAARRRHERRAVGIAIVGPRSGISSGFGIRALTSASPSVRLTARALTNSSSVSA